MSPGVCARCVEALPANYSPRKCAFPGGVFQPDNWNCGTANAIRDCTRQDEDDSRALWSEDQYAALLPWDGAFVVVGWYKHRGRTEYIGILDDSEVRQMTLDDANAYLEYHAAMALLIERGQR